MLLLLGEELAHVIRQPGDAKEAGLLVEHALDFRRRQPLFGGDMIEYRGVEITRPRPHHQPLERREAHGRVHRLSADDRARRAAVAKVERDDLRLIARTASVLSIAPSDVAI